MNEKLKVSFDKPDQGWLVIYLNAGEKHLKLPFPYTSFEFPAELVYALLNFSEGFRSKARCRHNPERYEFEFHPESEPAQVEVIIYPGYKNPDIGDVIFNYKGSRSEILLAFWLGVRELQARIPPEEYDRGYGREFPVREIKLLAEKIKGKNAAERL